MDRSSARSLVDTARAITFNNALVRVLVDEPLGRREGAPMPPRTYGHPRTPTRFYPRSVTHTHTNTRTQTGKYTSPIAHACKQRTYTKISKYNTKDTQTHAHNHARAHRTRTIHTKTHRTQSHNTRTHANTPVYTYI